jgi:hypothetical protein
MRTGFLQFLRCSGWTPLARLALVLAVLASSTSERAFATTQAIAQVPKTGPIPKNFKTWSLFLVCNPKWLDNVVKGNQATDLFQLYRQFQAFGRTIGDDNVAVWFWKSTAVQLPTAALIENVDVERSVRFCQAWKLAPTTTPAVVVTSIYPDEANLGTDRPGNIAVYQLGDLKLQDISDLLAKLANNLLLGKSSVPAAPSDATPQLWVRLLQATQSLLNQFGCKWTCSIDAGPVKADLKPCQNH